MQIFLVGGAVRNRLLGLPVTERDWVVVGASEREMEAAGFRPVGKDFPVFLHPESGEEYALARTERKTGKGHTGFECETEAVTLEEDLQRRDITINAMAEDEDGNLIDPWGGAADLEARVLRHVSAAFEEDPLRVLRVARFASLLAPLGFRVDSATRELMQAMTQRGDLADLAPERIWQETAKALETERPGVYFDVLDDVGAADVLWPEITQADLEAMIFCADRTRNPRFRFASLFADGPESRVVGLGERLRAPRKWIDLARLVASCFPTWLAEDELDAGSIVDFLYRVDVFRHDGRFAELLELFSILAARHRDDAEALARRWRQYASLALEVGRADVEAGLEGAEIGQAIRDAQATRIASVRDRSGG